NPDPPRLRMQFPADLFDRPGPKPLPKPDITDNVQAAVVSGTAVDLSWSEASGAESYRIQQLQEDGVTWTTLATQTKDQPKTFRVFGLTGGSGHIYSWRINSVNAIGTTTGKPVRLMLSYTSPNVDLDNKKRAFELLEAEELRH